MKIIRVVLTELVGMFVDDWRFALAIAALLAAVTTAVLLGVPALSAATLLLAGCIALLAWSVIRAARVNARR